MGAQKVINLGSVVWDNTTQAVHLAFLQYDCGGPWPNNTRRPSMNGTDRGGCEANQPVFSPWNVNQVLVMTSRGG